MRHLMRRAYVVGGWLLAVAVAAQLLLAGLGIFVSSAFFAWHASVGSLAVAAVSLLLLLVGWGGRVPRGIRTPAAVFGLVVLQSVLLFPYRMEGPGWLRAISAFHVINAVLISWLVLRLLGRLRGIGASE